MATGLADFLLAEEYDEAAPAELDAHGDDLVLPVRNRRPIDPGFVLTWREHPAGGGPVRERTGIVLSRARPDKSVWVVPDDRDLGEGYAVLVREVVSDDASKAVRHVGAAGDYASTADWQSPRSLPRAVLRVDIVHAGGDSPNRPAPYLHARPDCPFPPPAPSMNITVTRGEPQRVESCYVYAGRLHPASIRPPAPGGGERHDADVKPCGHCLRFGPPD